MHVLKKVSQQTLWQLAAKGVTSLSTIFILRFIATHFSEEITGIFTLAQTFLAFFVLAVDFGLNAYILPFYEKKDSFPYFRKLFGFRILLGFAVTSVAILLAGFWNNELFRNLVWFSAFFFIFESVSFSSASSLYQSRLRYEFPFITRLIGCSVTVLAVLVFIRFQSSIFGVMSAYIIGWVVMILMSCFFIFKMTRSLSPSIDKLFIKNAVIKSWPLTVTLLLNTVYFRADAFILSAARSFAEVGIYNLAYSIFQSLLVLPTYIMNAFFPIYIERKNKQEFKQLVFRSFVGMFGLGIVATVGTYFFSSFFIQLITNGKGFTGSVQALQFLSLGFPAFFASSAGMWVLITLDKYKSVTMIYLGGLFFNLIFNVIFIPQFSFVAASLITGISEYLILVLQLIILSKEFISQKS